LRTARLLALLATTAALAGCGETTSPEEPSSPHDDAAELRDDLMVAEPSTTRPGSQIELSFPQETGRGLGFVLEEELDDGWALRYFLTSAPADGGPNEPSWIPAAAGGSYGRWSPVLSDRVGAQPEAIGRMWSRMRSGVTLAMAPSSSSSPTRVSTVTIS